MNLSMRDWIWVMGIVAGIATTYGMMSSRVSALESKIKDLDMLRIDSRLSVIEIQVIEINEKLEQLRWIENNYKIKCINISSEHFGFAINTKEDLDRIRKQNIL